MAGGGNSSGGMRHPRLEIVLVLAAGACLVAATLVTGTTDPFGLSEAPVLAAANLGQWQPVYGDVMTPGWTLDWSPDGRWIAMGDNQFVTGVEIADAATGQIVRVIDVPGLTYSVRWSPDGMHLAVGTEGGPHGGGDGIVYVYARDGNLEHSLEAINWPMIVNAVLGVDWSPDGSMVIGAQGGRFVIWDATNGGILLRNANASVNGNSVDWSFDGRSLLFGYVGGATIFNASTGSFLRRLTDGSNDERGAAWSHSGTLIGTAGLEGCAAVFGEDGGGIWSRCYKQPGYSPMWAAPPSWNPDDTLLAIANEGGVFIANATTGELLRTLQFPVESYGTPRGSAVFTDDGPYLDFAAAFSPSGTILASVATTTHPSLRVWGIERSPVVPLIAGFGAAVAAGLPLAIGPTFVQIVTRPEEFRDRLAGSARVRSLGWILLGFAFGFALLQAVAGNF